MNFITYNQNINLQYLKFIFTVLFILILSSITLFSYGVGVDDRGYLGHWNNILPLNEYIFTNKVLYEVGLERFYTYLFSFFKLFTDDIAIFKFFNTFLALSVLAYSYYRVTSKYYLVLLLFTVGYFYIDVYIDQYRAGLSSAFGVLAIVLLSEGKIKSSLFWLFIGSIIHNSLIWLLILYIALYSKFFILIVLSLVIFIFIPNKVEMLWNILQQFNLIGADSHIARKLVSYTYKSIDGNSVSIFSLVMIKTIFIYFLALKYKINKIYLNTYLFAILLFYAFLEFNTFGARILRNILFVEPILLYYILKENTKWIFFVLLVLLFNLFAKNLEHLERIFY